MGDQHSSCRIYPWNRPRLGRMGRIFLPRWLGWPLRWLLSILLWIQRMERTRNLLRTWRLLWKWLGLWIRLAIWIHLWRIRLILWRMAIRFRLQKWSRSFLPLVIISKFTLLPGVEGTASH